jgi:uncharacterized membrane protein
MANLLQIFLLAMTPIGELRLAIPMGILVYHVDAFLVFFVSVAGNLAPAIFFLFFLKKLSIYLSKKSTVLERIFSWWENNAKEKHISKIQQYGAIGLAIFVATPLPLTGAWTGALMATMLNLPIKKSLPAIFIGVVGAGVIVTALMVLGVNIEKYFGWQTLAGALLLGVFATALFLLRNKKNNSKKNGE